MCVRIVESNFSIPVTGLDLKKRHTQHNAFTIIWCFTHDSERGNPLLPLHGQEGRKYFI